MADAPKHFEITPSFLGRLLAAEKTVFQVTEKGIEVVHKEGKVTVLFKDLLSQITAANGIFFYRIYVTTEDEHHAFRWLSSTEMNQAIDCVKREFYTFYATPVLTLQDNIKAQIKDQYPRKSFWKKARRASKALQKKYQALPPEGLLPTQQDSAFRYIDGVANNTVSLAALQTVYCKKQLSKYKAFFDTVESNPLTDKQRLACVIDEENNLVLAGAGSGKTSVMIGRAGYLLKSEQATSDEILLLAFANKAAAEMSDRILAKLGNDQVKASTFHSLGQHIISEVEGSKPSLSVLATDARAMSQYVETSFNELMAQEDYQEAVVKYFLYFRYHAINPFAYRSKQDYNRAVKDNDLRTQKGELVKDYQELLIANFLYKNNIAYHYEAKYEKKTKTLEFRQYQPDFYLPDFGVYLEHYGIDEAGNTAPFVDKQKYTASMQWKRELHQANNTHCIETFHYEWVDGSLLSELESKLRKLGITLHPIPNDQIISELESSADHPMHELHTLLGKMLKLFKASNMNGELFSLEEQVSAPSSFFKKVLERILKLFSEKQLATNNLHRMQPAQKLMMPLYLKYENHLLDNDDIDFDDMINKAIQYVESGEFTSPWKHIMVDEFQDISSSRAKLILALKKQNKDTSLFCVGDDWQSIYRFAGSDLNYVTAFKKHFGDTQTTTLDMTFRFNNSISDIASSFVSRNPDQIKKDISTYHHVSQPAVSLFRTDCDTEELRLANLNTVLSAISALKSESTVLILGRFGFSLPDKNQLRRFEQNLGNLKITAMTVHSSKGKEADFVIVLGLENGRFGFPSDQQEHPLIEALLPSAQSYPFAEERRLFYVAITRAKERSYLITDMKKPSSFVQELINDGYEVELDEFEVSDAQRAYEHNHCPVCEVSLMLPRKGKHGNFYGCSCYPRCNHIESGCKQCGAVMSRSGSYKICTDDSCDGWAPICPECGAELVARKGRYGTFWGCKNYRSEGSSCAYSTNTVEPPESVI